MTKRSLNNQQAMNKKERLVAAIKNGTVIDHIPVEKTFDVVNLLQLQHLSTPVTIGYNLSSKMVGTKGIIKVSDKFFTDDEISRLSVVAPNVVLNIIKDYEVVEKKKVETPDELRGIVKCNNPKCITNNEPMDTIFNVIDKEHGILKCHYCDKEQKMDKVELCYPLQEKSNLTCTIHRPLPTASSNPRRGTLWTIQAETSIIIS